MEPAIQQHEDPMLDYRRILLWLIVLLVPGGLLLLPALVVDARRGKARKSTSAAPEAARALAA
jgi:hypothetical protein